MPSHLYCNKTRNIDTAGEHYTWVDDRLSALSDDILVNVISRLTIKEAARTSILSVRWRYLWKWFTGCLNFDNSRTIAAHRLKFRGIELFDGERHKFVSWVNQVLRSLQGHTMEELRICFDVVSNCDIHNWIKFSVEKKVRRLELDFSRFPNSDVGRYTFPSYIDSYSSFSSLTSLRLKNVAVTGEVLEHLLSYCPILEVLSVTSSKCLENLKVSGSSLKLRYFKLKFSGLEHLEIQAPNLTSFEFDGEEREIPISFRNVPNLAEVSFGGYFSSYIMRNLCQFSSFIVRLHTLKLDLGIMQWEQWGAHELGICNNIPELYNLKHLELEINLSDDSHLIPCATFLNASTSLYKFTLKLYEVTPSAESTQKQSMKDYVYSSLSELITIRELELVGFEGCGADTEFVIYLIENDGLLHKVIIDPCKPYILGEPTESLYRKTARYQSHRKQAIQLATRLPLWEFVVL